MKVRHFVRGNKNSKKESLEERQLTTASYDKSLEETVSKLTTVKEEIYS